ncbi:bifunctional hydroxymethylpyrimidine kinase/phosphomethylpyrimidine kinase [Arcobacter vandammei]|uniref:bifunctional hydroxymethylpyrimidine kinase/phosphomethylpyrimidine kinase n=1 Tax=Arcobacter vandammei TaxID=2782243 RepID=UPI0018DF4C8A|nr:bifunctional hydroxymethylpyrimidine kinase/phosphomethylpyrimidine kinase [Arcobacter vandammei]
MKKVLTIAGSDCSGGAGIQADLKTFSAHGTFGMSVVTSVVAENTFRVADIQDVRVDIIEKQLICIFEDIVPDAIKIGMLGSKEIMQTVAKFLKEHKEEAKNIVIDPVMYAKNGCALMDIENINTLIAQIIPLADVLTPNIPEAEHIASMKIENEEDVKNACIKIHKMGCKSVLIKGGHSNGDEACDILYDGKEFYKYCTKKIDTKNTHGTGCTYSSAIAANLALGKPIFEALEISKEYITNAIKYSLEIGKGHGPTNHFYKFFKNQGE